jgi:hypothetical protein
MAMVPPAVRIRTRRTGAVLRSVAVNICGRGYLAAVRLAVPPRNTGRLPDVPGTRAVEDPVP